MSFSATSYPLVQTEWLAEHLDDPNLRVVDARWKPRVENGQGISADDYEGYLEGHIPGAVFVGMLNDLSDPSSPTSDMLAPPEQFAAVMSRLGIGDDTLVVAYDNIGLQPWRPVCGGLCPTMGTSGFRCSTVACVSG